MQRDDQFKAHVIREARTFTIPTEPGVVVWRVTTDGGEEHNYIIAPEDLGRLGKQMQADAALLRA